MKLEVNIEKKYFYVLASILVLGFLLVYVHAYNQPPATFVGHTWNELANIPADISDGQISWNEVIGKPSIVTSETDPTVPANLKDGIDMSEVSGKTYGVGCTEFDCKIQCTVMFGRPWADTVHTQVSVGGYSLCMHYVDGSYYQGATHPVITKSQNTGVWQCNCA